MSDLTEALDRILNWLQRQRREYPQATEEWWIRLLEEENNAPFVQPGLSSAEIEELTAAQNALSQIEKESPGLN